MIPADPVAAATTVPAGDPAELRAAASTLSASAETLESAAAAVERLGPAVPSLWAGAAARSCAAAQERAVSDCRALVRAMREAAAAVAQLAAELAEAIDDARRAAGQAADLAAALHRVDRLAGTAAPLSLDERARRLAADAARADRRGEAAAERARLANFAAAAAFEQVTATLPEVATLAAECAPATRSATRPAIDAQLATLLGRPLTPAGPPDGEDTLSESVLGLGTLLAGGVVVDFARKDRSKRGGRSGGATAGGGGPGPGKPPQDQGDKQRVMPGPVWTAQEAEAKALELGYVKTNYLSQRSAVFRKGNRYITWDRKGHQGGAWKMALSPEDLGNKAKRLGTYNEDLTQRLGD